MIVEKGEEAFAEFYGLSDDEMGDGANARVFIEKDITIATCDDVYGVKSHIALSDDDMAAFLKKEGFRF